MDSGSTAHGSETSVRPARRTDLSRIADLRLWYLAETARLEPRLKLTPEARERIVQACASWEAQEERVLLVAEGPVGQGPGTTPGIVGYATGVTSIWPPIWKTQRVGEVWEVFVVPAARGHGLGKALLEGVLEGLSGLGAEVLRAWVPVHNDGSEALFHANGFQPVLRVFDRGPEAR
jgi:GNAT superfamily N-acetyltransferase